MRIAIGILLVLVLVATVAGIASQAYNAGVARGLAEGGRVPGAPPAVVPYPYYGPFVVPFGFGFLGFLVPLFFIFLLFALLRGIFWRGAGWGWHPIGHWGKGGPPHFEEWHRRAHESKGETSSI